MHQAIHNNDSIVFVDKYFICTVLALIVIGVVMITSASMAISERQFADPFHYLFRQLLYLLLGGLIASIVVRVRMSVWHKMGFPLLGISIVMLFLVMIPGIGHVLNGSRRWLGVGSFSIQVSEFVKLAMVIYLAGYLVRHHAEVRQDISGFIKPMALLGLIGLLLLLEPDFGATVVIVMTAFAMMYLAGVRLWQFALLIAAVVILFGILAVSSPYRMARLTGFLNPWAHQFNSGYQLTQSLIAFGRGGLFGVGLGDSIQKLFYLPEAHTDFLFAVIAEEFGLFGILVIVGLYIVLVWRALLIGKRAQFAGQSISGYMAYGFAIWLAMQAVVNIGVNAGLLPTKGLTLPLVSYGGSSMLVIFVVIALLLRIDYEARFEGKQLPKSPY